MERSLRLQGLGWSWPAHQPAARLAAAMRGRQWRLRSERQQGVRARIGRAERIGKFSIGENPGTQGTGLGGLEGTGPTGLPLYLYLFNIGSLICYRPTPAPPRSGSPRIQIQESG